MLLAEATQQLAILGGEPAFSETLHVGRPNVGDRQQFMDYANQMFDNRWFSNHGPLVRQFEAELQNYLGVRHCIALCNATVALEIAIRALGLRGEVVVPSFTFVATAHALQWLGITPVFADINPYTHTLDLASVERVLTPRTTGIIGVHLWGNACDIGGLQRLASAYRLKLLFDAAHAFGCSHIGQKIGNFGNAEVFSFHATKFFNSFEGGAIATNDDSLAERIRLMQNFGFAGYDEVVYIGTNGKMNEASAAMGLTNLKSLEWFKTCNYCNYLHYRQAIHAIPGLRVFQYNETEMQNYQYTVVEVDSDRLGLTRDEVVKTLHAENVLARRYFWPGCHRMEPYRSTFPNAGLMLPNTEEVAERVFVLPTGTSVTENDIDKIVEILRLAAANSDRIRRRLAENAPLVVQ